MPSAIEYLKSRIDENPALLNQPWMLEHQRWTELIFCTLDQLRCADSLRTRRLVQLADELGLLDQSVLSDLSRDQDTVLRHLFAQAGWSEDDADRATGRLIALARKLQRAGGLNRLLEQAAAVVRQFMIERLADDGGLEPALAHWLQNTCALPATIDASESERYAQSAGFTFAQLRDAAHALGINPLVLDDVIRGT